MSIILYTTYCIRVYSINIINILNSSYICLIKLLLYLFNFYSIKLSVCLSSEIIHRININKISLYFFTE